jgi:hypothetical protein
VRMSELEQRLVAAAPHYPFPETPSLAAAARARLPERRRGSRARLAAAFAVALAVVGGVVLAASPGARSGILDLLDRVPGIHIERRISLPDVGYTQTPSYGIEMGLDEAEQRFGRPLRLPSRVGEPEHVYWLQFPPGDMITAIYGGDDRRAELVFSQWKTAGPDLFHKVLLGNSEADAVQVDGASGIWIHGGEHLVWFIAPGDSDRGVGSHWGVDGWLAGNVLAWRVGDVVYRLEADVPLDRALEIAGTLEER